MQFPEPFLFSSSDLGKFSSSNKKEVIGMMEVIPIIGTRCTTEKEVIFIFNEVDWHSFRYFFAL